MNIDDKFNRNIGVYWHWIFFKKKPSCGIFFCWNKEEKE